MSNKLMIIRSNKKRWSPVVQWKKTMSAALLIRASQGSITDNIWSLTTHIYHVMIIVTGGFSKKIFLLLLFPENSFERS